MQPKTTTTTVDHILWHEEANELIKRYPKQRQRQQQQQEQFPFIRHSTGGCGGLLYTHPSAIAMMTLTKHASDGGGRCIGITDAFNGNNDIDVVSEQTGIVGNELLTVRQRHQRDLFSGDLGLPPIPPPPPPSAVNLQRTHVGNVVHTFETLAMQRRLAAFKQQQQQLQKQQLKNKNQLQQQSNTFSKYLKCNNKFTKFIRKQTKQQQQQQNELQEFYLSLPSSTTTATTISHNFNCNNNNNNNFHTEFKCKTFNERNKQIAQHYMHQMEIDYRKNLFSNNSHVNNNNNNNNNHLNIVDEGISEGEAGVVAKFDEMLAGFSLTEDDDDDNDMRLQNDAHVSIININGNEAQDNVLRINLSSSNDGGIKPTTKTKQKQLISTNMNQRLLPVMRKKPAPPVPPPKPVTKTTTTTTARTKQQYNSCNMTLNNEHSKHNKYDDVDNAVHESNDFLRGSTLSQSFVRHTNFQQHKLKPKAPKPPKLPITTPNVHNITKDNTTTQLRISLTNPFRHILRLNTKRADSFNLIK